MASSDTVRNVAAAALTAGLIKEFGGELLSQPDAEVTLDIVDDIQKQLITAGIKTGVDATVSGANLSDSLKQNLRFGASALIGAQLSQEIGAAFHDGDINRTAQLIAPTATGCVAGAVGTGNCSANAVAQVTGEIASIIHGDLTVDDIDDVTQNWAENNIDMARLSGALAAAVAGGDADDVNLGVDAGGVAAENNALQALLLFAGLVAGAKGSSDIILESGRVYEQQGGGQEGAMAALNAVTPEILTTAGLTITGAGIIKYGDKTIDAVTAYRHLRASNGVNSAGLANINDLVNHNFKYAKRIRTRALEDPKAHNFPYSYDDDILKVTPQTRDNGYKIYQKSGTMNGKKGVYELGLTQDGVIDHRFFRPE